MGLLFSLLSLSVLGDFEPVTNPLVHRPDVGADLVLRCNPPQSYPSGDVYWSYDHFKRLPPYVYIPLSSRVSLGYDSEYIASKNAHGNCKIFVVILWFHCFMCCIWKGLHHCLKGHHMTAPMPVPVFSCGSVSICHHLMLPMSGIFVWWQIITKSQQITNCVI